MKFILMAIGLIFAIMTTNGCSSSHCCENSTKAVDLENRSISFREGYRNGCTTAHGEYAKDSQRFKSDREYYDGWFAGRSACQYDDSKQ